MKFNFKTGAEEGYPGEESPRAALCVELLCREQYNRTEAGSWGNRKDLGSHEAKRTDSGFQEKNLQGKLLRL